MTRTKYQVTYYHNQRKLLKLSPTPIVAARWAYRRIKKRIKECAYYSSFSPIKQEDLLKFYIDNWKIYLKIHKIWAEKGYQQGDCPSIDRINPNFGYELNNMRIIPHRENSRLAVKNRIKGRPTHCPKGHPYNEGNSGKNKFGYRFCKRCNSVNSMRSQLKKKKLSVNR
jgi:hypothetical protein